MARAWKSSEDYMITLKQAFSLCRIQDSDIVYLRLSGSTRYDGQWWTGKNVRSQFDMKNTEVKHINVRFAYEGDFEGFEFELSAFA